MEPTEPVIHVVAREEWHVRHWLSGEIHVFDDRVVAAAFAKRINGSDVDVKRVRYYSKAVSL